MKEMAMASELKKDKMTVDSYEVSSAFSDFVNVEKHKKDPKLMKLVQAYAKKQKASADMIMELECSDDKKIKSVDDLRKARAESEPDEDD